MPDYGQKRRPPRGILDTAAEVVNGTVAAATLFRIVIEKTRLISLGSAAFASAVGCFIQFTQSEASQIIDDVNILALRLNTMGSVNSNISLASASLNDGNLLKVDLIGRGFGGAIKSTKQSFDTFFSSETFHALFRAVPNHQQVFRSIGVSGEPVDVRILQNLTSHANAGTSGVVVCGTLVALSLTMFAASLALKASVTAPPPEGGGFPLHKP